MIDILALSSKVLERLTNLDSEKEGGNSNEQLIFPSKKLDNGNGEIRISEQEMRFLFVEEFKIKYPNLFYSIETPTKGKFSFGKTNEDIKLENEGQSASHDMCVYEKSNSKYKRILNIEFKHRNSGIAKSGKDILKLIREEQNGTFIHLLENTDSNTLINVFKKLLECFEKFKELWLNENKSIQVVILSLKQKKLVYCELQKKDLLQLNQFFVLEQKLGNIDNFKNSFWTLVDLNKN